ncbi:MoaD/ThiS family protein [Egibacter rhizosphaerae]|uniref:MoaD/ThiS family protein n=1 Tax=Egibacter rhizosphaerae TaxID=1670831 RepID=UPI0013F15EEE|nr:MoaD family protein [Egibacter rhizosphaerae]
MAVTVRMFAALREAAGETETQVPAGSVAEVLAEVRRRYGEPFTSRLALASVLVDGNTVDHDADTPVEDGAEVALLPPFSGGGFALFASSTGWAL